MINYMMETSFLQVKDIVDRAFVSVFDSLNEKCNKELAAIAKQYPFKPLEVELTLLALKL